MKTRNPVCAGYITMRGAIIGPDNRLQSDLRYYEVRLNKTLSHDTIKIDSLLRKSEAILTLLTAGFYSWIMFRLSLDGFAALRIAEIAHKVRSPVKLILNSETSVPKEVLLELFDFFNPGDGEKSDEYLEQAFSLGGMPRRLSSGRAVNEAVQNILAEASCFDTYERELVPIERSPHSAIDGGFTVKENRIHPLFVDYRKFWGEAPLFVSPKTKDTKRRVRTILFLSASPKDTPPLRLPPLRLGEEIKRIEQGLERSSRREQFKLIGKSAVTDVDLRRALIDYKPDIVHFSGHGAGSHGLAFENNQGQIHEISSESLAGLFDLCKDHVECVILNACYSENQAEAIVQHIQYVVGMKSEISDDAAIEFAVGFYDALGAGEDYETAFKFGRVAIDLRGIPHALTPVLKERYEKERYECYEDWPKMR